jgi:class 3 adenylate cyclase
MSDTESVGHAEEQKAEQRLRDYILNQHKSRLGANGVVTGKDVCQILESLGLPFEETEVKPLLPDWTNVTPDAAVEAVTTVRITHNAELHHMIQRMEEGVIRLSVFEYLWYKSPFSSKDPTWQHRAVEFSLDLAPRQILFVSTGVVLLVAGMAILLLMSLLWLDQSGTRDEVRMGNFHLLLQSFAESFEQRFLEVHASTMVDEADTLAKMLDRQHQIAFTDFSTDAANEAALVAGVVDVAASTAFDTLIQPQSAMLTALRATFAADVAAGLAAATLTEIVATVTALNSDAASDRDAPWQTLVATLDEQYGMYESIALEPTGCASGTCDYRNLPCVLLATGITPPATAGPQTLDATSDMLGAPATAVFTRLDSVSTPAGNRHVVLCSLLPGEVASAARKQAMVEAVAAMNGELTAPLSRRREIVLAELSGNSTQFTSPLLRIPGTCFVTSTCNALNNFSQSIIADRAIKSMQLEGYTGLQMLAGGAPATEVADVAVLLLRDVDGLLADERDQLVAVVDRMNQASSVELEVSVGRRDPSTGAILPQLTAFRNAALCLRPCERTAASSVAVTLAINTRGAGFVEAVNYQPVAVLAAYSFVGNNLDLAIVVERNVTSIRDGAVRSLVSIFEANNAAYAGSLEAQLVAYRGFVPTKTYDPTARCDQIRDCERDDNIGVLYRSDCVHCSRRPDAVASHQVISLTKLKFQAECNDRRDCSVDSLAMDDGLWRFALDRQSSAPLLVRDREDYRGEPVLATVSYVQNLSIAIVVKIDEKETRGPILEHIGIASGVAILVVIVGLVVLILFSRKVLDRIELEWLTYKDQIDSEKKKFDAMVQNVLPVQVSEELKRTQKLAISLPSMSFVFLDVVGMSERTKSWSPELVCRYITYIFTVVDKACSHYSLNKVRVFGDTYFAVGGLGESATEEHCVFRSACFGSVAVQLLSPRFAHYPDRLNLIRETFEDFVAKNGPVFPDVTENPEDVGHVTMPPIRVGMHYGIGTFCIIETGRTPAYEVFGPGVALAARMQSTSLSNRIHMSGAMKEVLERLDKEKQFDFEAMRKTVVKGQGTITSYFVRSATVNVPLEILQYLGIEYANRRVFYEEATGAGAGANGPSAAGGPAK